jgi:hypothetical protein
MKSYNRDSKSYTNIPQNEEMVSLGSIWDENIEMRKIVHRENIRFKEKKR